MPWAATEAARPWSAAALHLFAAVLMGASALLERAAKRLAAAERTASGPLAVEFHPIYRDSGAPEGALYVDGRLVGMIEGVTRL
jgi:hypothetical protein